MKSQTQGGKTGSKREQKGVRTRPGAWPIRAHRCAATRQVVDETLFIRSSMEGRQSRRKRRRKEEEGRKKEEG